MRVGGHTLRKDMCRRQFLDLAVQDGILHEFERSSTSRFDAPASALSLGVDAASSDVYTRFVKLEHERLRRRCN